MPDSASHLSTTSGPGRWPAGSSAKASSSAATSALSISWLRLSSSRRPRLGGELLSPPPRPSRFRVDLALVAVRTVHLDVVLGLCSPPDARSRPGRTSTRAPGQVGPSPRGAERRVGESLSGPPCVEMKYSKNGETLHEVGLDRPLDDPRPSDWAIRASHSSQLADLLERATGSGVGHHENRIELVEVCAPSPARPPRSAPVPP